MPWVGNRKKKSNRDALFELTCLKEENCSVLGG